MRGRLLCAAPNSTNETHGVMAMQSDILPRPKLSTTRGERKRQILIIEDDESISEVLAYRFESNGYTAVTSHRGMRGLELAREDRPDLIMLDVRLPDVDGLTVCRQLDDDPQTCGIPVIILTGMSRPDIIRKARGAGCTYYVRKPYDPNALLILVEQALREPGPHWLD